MNAPIPPTQVYSLSKRENKSIKSDTPRTDRLGTQPDVNDTVITSISEASDAQLAV